MVNRLVVENLKHRPVRTLVSALAIGVQSTLMLTLVGVSRGTVDDKVFVYAWWPILRPRRKYENMSHMRVEVRRRDPV